MSPCTACRVNSKMSEFRNELNANFEPQFPPSHRYRPPTIPVTSVLITRWWPIHPKRNGTGCMISHSGHNRDSFLDKEARVIPRDIRLLPYSLLTWRRPLLKPRNISQHISLREEPVNLSNEYFHCWHSTSSHHTKRSWYLTKWWDWHLVAHTSTHFNVVRTWQFSRDVTLSKPHQIRRPHTFTYIKHD